MTIRRGMSGDSVKRVQVFLAGLKLYNGGIDSIFGGGLESAVKLFQRSQNLPINGTVDADTWGKMFPGEQETASEMSTRPLSERCLSLTGSFETGKYPPDCFWGLSGDFDGMGISFGALQWNIGQGSLQPLLKKMFDQHTGLAQDIFHEHFDTIHALGSAPLRDQLTFSRSIQTKGSLQEPWQGMLFTLGRTREFQDIQADHAGDLFDQAVALCNKFGLVSERAVALLFDVVTQGGSINPLVTAQILADFKSIAANDPNREVKKMQSVANRRAEASKQKFVDDVRTRKLAIANGTGTVHGIYYDLDDMFGLTLNPFAQATSVTV